jgi:hypothetical protein
VACYNSFPPSKNAEEHQSHFDKTRRNKQSEKIIKKQKESDHDKKNSEQFHINLGSIDEIYNPRYIPSRCTKYYCHGDRLRPLDPPDALDRSLTGGPDGCTTNPPVVRTTQILFFARQVLLTRTVGQARLSQEETLVRWRSLPRREVWLKVCAYQGRLLVSYRPAPNCLGPSKCRCGTGYLYLSQLVAGCVAEQGRRLSPFVVLPPES